LQPQVECMQVLPRKRVDWSFQSGRPLKNLQCKGLAHSGKPQPMGHTWSTGVFSVLYIVRYFIIKPSNTESLLSVCVCMYVCHCLINTKLSEL
jgi:hypothetical protein